MKTPNTDFQEETLDPQDWSETRKLGHQMIDDMLDYLENVRERPTWQPTPEDVRSYFKSPLPEEPGDIYEVYEDFKKYVLPYPVGNIHPRFLGMGFWNRDRIWHVGRYAKLRDEFKCIGR